MNSKGNQVEQALRDSQARPAGIVDSAIDAVINAEGEQLALVFDRAPEIIFRSRALEAIRQSPEHDIAIAFRRFTLQTSTASSKRALRLTNLLGALPAPPGPFDSKALASGATIQSVVQALKLGLLKSLRMKKRLCPSATGISRKKKHRG